MRQIDTSGGSLAQPPPSEGSRPLLLLPSTAPPLPVPALGKERARRWALATRCELSRLRSSSRYEALPLRRERLTLGRKPADTDVRRGAEGRTAGKSCGVEVETGSSKQAASRAEASPSGGESAPARAAVQPLASVTSGGRPDKETHTSACEQGEAPVTTPEPPPLLSAAERFFFLEPRGAARSAVAADASPSVDVDPPRALAVHGCS